MSNVQRIPRPLGATQLAYSTKDYKRVKLYLIQTFINQGILLNGNPISLPQFLNIYNISTKDFNDILTKIAEHSGLKQDTMASTYRALFSTALGWALNDRHIALSQYHTLKGSQGDGYVPFVSKEVNSSISLLLNSTKGLTDVLKTINTSQTNININNEVHQTQNQFTMHQASDLLSEHNKISVMDSPEELEALGQAPEMLSIPEVRATHQRGYVVQGALAIRNNDNADRHDTLNTERIGLNPDDDIILP